MGRVCGSGHSLLFSRRLGERRQCFTTLARCSRKRRPEDRTYTRSWQTSRAMAQRCGLCECPGRQVTFAAWHLAEGPKDGILSSRPVAHVILTQPLQKQIGMWNWTQLMEGLEGMSNRLFLQILGWKREDLDRLLGEVRADLRNPRVHAIFDMYVRSNQSAIWY